MTEHDANEAESDFDESEYEAAADEGELVNYGAEEDRWQYELDAELEALQDGAGSSPS